MQIARMLTVAALAALVASPAMAQQDTTHGAMVSAVAKANTGAKSSKSSKHASLKSQAKITEDSARVIAMAKVPAGSKINEAELEHEKGTVVWSFDIRVPGKTGVEEVLVSAIDGHVVSQSHESADAEKAEQAKEKKQAAKKP